MDTFLDTLWEYIVITIQYLGDCLFAVLQHLHVIGPIVLITMLAMCTVAVTKFLNRVIVTKRYIELEKEFQHWFNLRQEAIKCEDPEKGKHLARNIDQAQLNKAYYDYFFEGFMLGLARKVMPIFFTFAFINEYYRTEELLRLFGKGYLFSVPTTSGEPLLVGAVFYYFIALLLTYLAWSVGKKVTSRKTSIHNHPVKPLMVDTPEIKCQP